MGSTIAAVLVAAVVAVLLMRPAAPGLVSVAPGGSPRHSGAVQLGADSCAYAYSPDELRRRTAFSFDGTVTGIASRPVDGFGSTPVTFRVNEWFHGGSAGTVVLEMMIPGSSQISEFPPLVSVGTRLLVSGAHRGDAGAGRLDVVWGCGFTRYYDPETAAAWRAAFGR